MGKPKRPRFGSMGVWPRVRAKKPVARVRSYAQSNDAELLGFAGYKAGMTHALITGQDKNKRNFGLSTFTPVTIIECPPLKIASARLYKNEGTAEIVAQQLNFKTDKELARKLTASKKKETADADSISKINAEEFSKITVQVYTIPKETGLKKTPELFELALGGSVIDQIEFLKNNYNKTISAGDILKEGDYVDVRAVTSGKGFQGPIRRFGIGIRNHKSEKAIRNPGSLGGWVGQAHVMYRVAHAGQTGYHQRIQYNNQILKISDKPEEINPAGGFINFGEVKTSYIMIKGSIPGPKKRLVLLTRPVRQKENLAHSSENIEYISKHSHQGR